KQEGSVPSGSLLCEFMLDGVRWKVYEDFTSRDGAITFVSDSGETVLLGKSAEASFPDADPAHLGFDVKDIGLTQRDILADKLLSGGGDPDPIQVRAA